MLPEELPPVLRLVKLSFPIIITGNPDGSPRTVNVAPTIRRPKRFGAEEMRKVALRLRQRFEPSCAQKSMGIAQQTWETA